MPIPDVSREQLITAMELFDQEMRDQADWSDWEQNEDHQYAIQHDGKRYPVKQIVSLATGVATHTFNGDDEANNYVRKKGFPVISFDRSRGDDQALKTQPFDRASLDVLIQRFTNRYDSFTAQAYLDDERNYKLEASKRVHDLLAEDRLRKLIEQGQFEEAKTEIKRAYRGNNLLNQWDVRPIMDAPAESLAHRLYDLLYGTDPFPQRFNAWVAVLGESQERCWPSATFYLMLHDPQQHLFIKPGPYRAFLEAVQSSIQWESRPSADRYERLRDLGRTLLVELAPLGARDMIDVQSFIWFVMQEADGDIDAGEDPEDEALEQTIAEGTTGQQPQLTKDLFDKILLQAVIDHGGTAQIEQINHAVEAHIVSLRNGAGFDDQKRTNLHQHIKKGLRRLVNRGHLVEDKDRRSWRITTEGRSSPENAILNAIFGEDDDTDEQDDVGEPHEPLQAWQASIETSDPFISQFVNDYPAWLTTTFGKHVEFRGLQRHRFSIFSIIRGRSTLCPMRHPSSALALAHR